MKMELWDVAPGHSVACIRTVRGEIPVPDYDFGGAPVVVSRNGDIDESVAVADDLDVMELKSS